MASRAFASVEARTENIDQGYHPWPERSSTRRDEDSPSKEHEDAGLVILTGCQRSGTHLFARAIEKRADIMAPSETRFPTLFSSCYRWAGDLNDRAARERLVRAIFVFLWIWENRRGSSEDIEKVVPYSLVSLVDRFDFIVDNSRSYGDILRLMFQLFGEKFEKSLVMDKIVYYHPEDISDLMQHLPEDTKVVHIVRDGRDVYLSWTNVWFGASGIVEGARRWRAHVLEYAGLARLGEERFREIRYEDLLREPAAVCDEVARWIDPGAHAAAGDASHGKGEALSVREGYENLSRPLMSSNSNKWREKMSESDVALFEHLASDALARFGYDVDGPSADAGRLTLETVRSYARNLTRATTYKRWVLFAVPVFLLASDRLGLPFSRRMFRKVQGKVRAA